MNTRRCKTKGCTRERAAGGSCYCDRCRKRMRKSSGGFGLAKTARKPSLDDLGYDRKGVRSMHHEFIDRLGYSSCQSRGEDDNQ